MKPVTDVRQISEIAYGFMASKTLFAALELDLFSRIAHCFALILLADVCLECRSPSPLTLDICDNGGSAVGIRAKIHQDPRTLSGERQGNVPPHAVPCRTSDNSDSIFA